jgi:hypothetical protein
MDDRRDEDMKLPIHTDQRASRGNKTRQMKGAITALFCVMANVNQGLPRMEGGNGADRFQPIQCIIPCDCLAFPLVGQTRSATLAAKATLEAGGKTGDDLLLSAVHA